jgi:hypothetical protein
MTGSATSRAGVIGLGQEAFEQVVADPDMLADHPMVQAIAAGAIDPLALGRRGDPVRGIVCVRAAHG